MLKKLTLVFLAAALVLSAADPFIGAWKLNVAKSKYNPGPAPKAGTITYTQDGDWIVVKNETVDPQGKPATATNRYKRDGKEHPYVSATGDKGTIAIKAIDANTTESTIKAGKATTNLHTVIAKDGKTLTRTVKGTDAQGQKLDNLTVFEKQ